MARETLDKKIQHLLDEVLILDSMVEDAISAAVDTLKNRSLKAAKIVHDGDELVNKKRFELENDVISTIATQQPIMAGDLRLLASFEYSLPSFLPQISLAAVNPDVKIYEIPR